MTILRIQTPRAFLPFLPHKRYKGAYGGRGGGKSHQFAEMAIERCIADAARVVCIREVQNSLKDSVRQLLVDKIQTLGCLDQFEIVRDEIRGFNGSMIIFKGMNDANADSIKSLEGYDVAWVEEAHTLSQRSLDLLRPTIRKDGAELWFSWNPRHQSDPVDEFFRKRPPADAVGIRINYQDNPWFPQALLKEMAEDRLADPAKAAHVWDGAYEPAPAGNYYGVELAEAETEGRISDFILDPVLPVHTAWDLGVAGNMKTWLFQMQDNQPRFVDFIEYDTPGLGNACIVLDQKQRERRFKWGTHLWPHDGASVDVGSESGEARNETMRRLGYPVEVLPRTSLADGIEATRRFIQTARFHRERTKLGLEHLRGYRRKFDRVHDRFLEEPEKNGHDHAADALRTAAMGREKLRNEPASGWGKDIMNFKASWVA